MIEACARVMSALLASRVWSWGRAEREIVAPHASAALFWRRAAAPYRALAVRLYSRLCACDASPVLSAGAGAPLLKLWALAALGYDPTAADLAALRARAAAAMPRLLAKDQEALREALSRLGERDLDFALAA